MTIQTQPVPETSRLECARSAASKEACMALYDEWATSYNKDVSDASQNYVAPRLVADIAVRFLEHESRTVLSIFDAGCGTGLVGQALADLSKAPSRGGLPGIKIDGADLSASMLKLARATGIYRNLSTVDLTMPIALPDNSYDIVTCCETFTHGHVGPDPALRELVRIVKPGGLVAATVVHGIWQEWGFAAEAASIEKDDLASVVSAQVEDYRRGAGDEAVFLALRKGSSSSMDTV
ncbi:S-adenosyl-L-methionine-dependent methyltransferase [Aspergillus carlsbadensis]|nr:S-adenosyl-L-methionine-dependent methyltransferase [Aspergillus carlsbadensis]